MRPVVVAALLALSLGACSPRRPPAPATAEAPRDVARTEPGKEDEPTQVFDETARGAALAERFPGARTLDLVRVLSWTEDRAGACWTESPPPWETKVDARYRVAGGGEETAASMKELRRQGWLTLYRTPNGAGFERRAPFRSIDLTFETTYACRCVVGVGGAPIERKIPLRLRFRWQGEGRMPEVSAATERDGKKEGLLVAFAPGNILSYEFPVRAPFPAGGIGTCGGTVLLSLLATPPMQ